MNTPDNYHKSHNTLKEDVGKLFKIFSKELKWQSEGDDTFCDIGTGPGDFFNDYIYPTISKKCNKIILSDISKEMLEYCQNNMQHSEKIEYKRFDIAAVNGIPIDLEGQFDHLTSMLVLHWVSDYRVALRNTLSLLRPQGGDCIVIFFSCNSFCKACNKLSNSSKWSSFTQGRGLFILPFEDSNDSKKDFRNMMLDEGFRNINVDKKTILYDYGSASIMREGLLSVCRPLEFIPKARREEFLDDLLPLMAEIAANRLDINTEKAKSLISVDLIVAYGQRLYIENEDDFS
uniref:Methyltransferase type 11 domain-containing protein n=1 Tax=Stomoxys calcitrans TaxID=35570 RepID=A0A1I8QF53_STOCA